MRGIRRLLLTAMVGTSMLVAPTDAFANGGASLAFDQTHYVPGDDGVATGYVSVPNTQRHLLDRGPFYLFAVPIDMTLREGRPIPAGAIQLGTFTIEAEGTGTYELRAVFTAPGSRSPAPSRSSRRGARLSCSRRTIDSGAGCSAPSARLVGPNAGSRRPRGSWTRSSRSGARSAPSCPPRSSGSRRGSRPHAPTRRPLARDHHSTPRSWAESCS
jgi:hypothetical protein